MGSLNCNSLIKSHNPQTQSEFLSSLRSSNFDILTLQETHAHPRHLFILNAQLRPQQALWTPHCGILSYSDGFHLSDNLLHIDDRVILTHADYHLALQNDITSLLKTTTDSESPQCLWDRIKKQVKKTTKTYAVSYASWRKKTVKELQRKRNVFLRSLPRAEIRVKRLTRYDKAIHTLHQEIAAIMALKTGEKWKNGAETSIKYLNGLYKRRQMEQHMSGLRPSPNESIQTESTHMLPIAHEFYAKLYAEDAVHEPEIVDYLHNIRDLPTMSQHDAALLTQPITLEEILSATKKVVSKTSSPGEDGLSYALLYELFRFSPLQATLLQVFNQALLDQTVPESWQDIRVRLLPKKGDITLLKNWRPISLINCDAKIFTRIINARVCTLIPDLITPHQTGFMPSRFIADNGLVLQILSQHARRHQSSEVALLLDQYKAYDCVHPLYLRHVLLRFGFPSVFVNSLIHLLFGNNVFVNVNGHFTQVVHQQRGLRQGDPL
jgi:hypothetical protein